MRATILAALLTLSAGAARAQSGTTYSAGIPQRVVIVSPLPIPVSVSGAISSFTVTGGTITAYQGGAWTVDVGNFPSIVNVVGTVSVSNFPSTFTVSGSTIISYQGGLWDVSVNNFPIVQAVSQSGAWTVTPGTGTWDVTGTVSVDNFPALVDVTGSSVTVFQGGPWSIVGTVSVDNFPAVQAVSQSGSWSVTPGSGTWAVTQSGIWNVNAQQQGAWTVTPGSGTFAISAVSLPLPTGAATESTLVAVSTTATAIKNRADLLATEATLATRATESTQVAVSTTLAAIKARADLLGTEATLATRASETTLVALTSTTAAIRARADLLATEQTQVAISTTVSAIKARADLLATEATAAATSTNTAQVNANTVGLSTTTTALLVRAQLLATESTLAAVSTNTVAISSTNAAILSTNIAISTLTAAQTPILAAISTNTVAISSTVATIATNTLATSTAAAATAANTVGLSTTATNILLTNIAVSTNIALINQKISSNTVGIIVSASTNSSISAYPMDGYKATYSTATLSLAPAATPSDVCTLTGSASKTIRVTRVTFSASQTNSDLENILLLKRSSANSAGTSISSNGVPHDSASASGTATFRSYTANPTLGTLVGPIVTRKQLVIATAPLATAPEMDWLPLYEAVRPSQSIVLRGTAEVLSINLNGVTLTGGSINCGMEWTEE